MHNRGLSEPAASPDDSDVLPSFLRDAFGFTSSEENWFAGLRARVLAPPLGRIGSFELLAAAGRGGQGVVYRARQSRPAREVALKRLAAGAFATPSMRARFEREIEAAAALDHPHIVTLYGSEMVDDQLVLVMQWVDGVPFNIWARPANGTPRPIREVLGTFVRACDAIHHAHRRGVIHRDLKPSNILVDAEDQPHVLDFGLAKLRGNEELITLTQSSNFLGTPAYAAPEQLTRQNREVDVRTDVYGLGVTLYEALGGRRPFEDAQDLARLLEAVKNDEPPPPSAANRGIARDLDAIVLKAIAKEKDRRYGSVEALADDLRRFLAGDAVEAHAPSTLYRCKKLFRRYAVVMSLAGLLLAAILTLGVVSLVQAAREHGLRVAADEARGAAEREAKIQRETADALVELIERVTSSASNRRSIEIKSLVNWLVQPIENDTLKLRPDVRVKLHKTACELYRWTNQLDAAIRHNALALETMKTIEPPDRELRHFLLCRRAGLLTIVGRYPEAESAARDALSVGDADFGRVSFPVSIALRHLFGSLWKQGRIEEAEEAILEAVRILELVDSSPQDTAEAKLLLSEVWLERKEFDKAVAYLVDLLGSLRDTGRGRAVQALWTMNKLGLVAFQLGRFEEAERYFGELAEIRVKQNGLKYARTSNDLQCHAWALHSLGRYDEVIQRLEQALIYQEHEARSAVSAARMRFEIAVAMLADGRDDEGRRQLLRAISRGAVTGPGDEDWDARAAAIEAALREHQLRYDETLAEKLGEFSWLLSERTRFGQVSQTAAADAELELKRDPSEP